MAADRRRQPIPFEEEMLGNTEGAAMAPLVRGRLLHIAWCAGVNVGRE